MMNDQFTIRTSACIEDNCPMQYLSDEDDVDVVIGPCDDGVQLSFTRRSLANLIALANHAVHNGATNRNRPVTLANLTPPPSRSTSKDTPPDADPARP